MAAPQFDNTNTIESNSFTEGMVKDVAAAYSKKGSWSHARNAVINNHDGELGKIGNEPANKLCTTTNLPIIQKAFMNDDQWVIFSGDNVQSEIGIFDESKCSYTAVVNDPCLGFKMSNRISAVVKKNSDCTFSVYWSDEGNIDRHMNLSHVPYKAQENSGDDLCTIKYTNQLDCVKLAMSRVIVSPSLRLRKGASAGTLLNGTYQAVIAYTTNGIRVTDRFTPSNPQSLFSHQNLSGSLELIIDQIDTSFDEFELIIIANVNRQATAKRVGIYSTRQSTIVIDYIDQTLPTVPLETILIPTPAYDKSDRMVSVNNHLLRIGVRTATEFNYQPQANAIIAHWVAMELPADYYTKGGNITSYQRDEQQPFFIRWVWNSGKRSASFPLVGRAATSADFAYVSGEDVYEHEDGEELVQRWEVENTATVLNVNQYVLGEGKVIAEGQMGYWQSTERYPQKPAVWKELCGQPIRHAKFPDNGIVPHVSADGSKIVVLGVKFEGIKHPLNINGVPIEGIVGYEILKANREGHKTIVAKGMMNSMGEYTIADGISEKKGLYPNYPYNDLRKDPFLSETPVVGGCKQKGYKEMGTFRKDVFSFHSPETQFRNPFLSAAELKIYGEMSGTVTGGFQKVYKHPRHKMMRDFAVIISGLIGVGTGILSVKGKTTTSTTSGRNSYTNHTVTGQNAGTISNTIGSNAASTVALNKLKTTYIAAEAAYSLSIITGNSTILKIVRDKALIAYSNAKNGGNGLGGETTISTETNAHNSLPAPLQLLGGAGLFTFYVSQGMESTLKIIQNLVPFQQYALQYVSHGLYNKFIPSVVGNKRRKINDAEYLGPQIQEFADKYHVNNLFRSRQVIMELSKEIDDPKTVDTTRTTVGQRRAWTNPFAKFNSVTSAHYAALKIPMKNQFGQIDSMSLLPVSTVIEITQPDKVRRYTSSILFGGDIYINRYTEKNTFFFFNDWMHDLNDGAELDYKTQYNIPNPRYWINTQQYDLSQLTSAALKLNFKGDVLPNDLAQLDRDPKDCTSKVSFIIKNGYFYLFSSGVRDFFVESEINLAQRDWDELDSERHYDPFRYTDLTSMFRSDIIKAGNHFKYDYSLSVSKLLLNNASWGALQERDYDPFNQECYTYLENRVIYSLQQQDELKKDNWLAFLANNYKDFNAKITTIESINKTGAIILFENDSPLMFQGVDTLQTESGTKLTIGDGGLFAQPEQQVTNSNRSYEFGSCQNVDAIQNTPAGLFWMSVNQGKIFTMGGGLQDIVGGMKYWFAQYLPFKLLVDFPDFQLRDNSLVGIGAQMIYNNSTEVLYFCKKDYELKARYRGKVTQEGPTTFDFNGIKFELGSKDFFNDASFTVSYHVAEKKWISYHDWFPDLLLPSKNHFLSVKGNGVWKHNQRCDLFTNFYGVDYPFEVEHNQPTGQEVAAVRSLEYHLECFRYFNECRDAHHVLDENFDRMIVYNTEQISGLIKLKIKPKNSPVSVIQSTQNNPESVSMFCSKEENKYRVNGINDLTRDRGEFSGKERQIWITEPNGYVKAINPVNVNYNKSLLQRKKMRHTNNKIFFRKNVSGSTKMLLTISNVKLTKSAR